MSVVRTGERKGRRSTSEGEDGTQTHQRVFYAKTDADTDYGPTVLAAQGIPKKNDQHPEDFNAIVIGRTPRELQKGHWEVDIEYGQRPPSEPPGSQGGKQSLLLRDPQIAISFQNMLVPLSGQTGGAQASYISGVGRPAGDVWSDGIANSAGEPFDPPVMRQKSQLVISITRHEAAFDNENALRFIDSVNNAAIKIAGFDLGVRTAKMMGLSTPGIAWETFEEQQFFTFPVTYTIHVNVETWDIIVLQHGTYYIDASDGNKKKAFLTDEGQPRIGLLTDTGDDNESNPARFKTILGFPYQENWGVLKLPDTMLPKIGQGGQPGAAAGENR